MSDADRTTALADALLDAAAVGSSVASARFVEVGIGERPDVARALAARGATVVVTDVAPDLQADVDERSVSCETSAAQGELTFVRDDVTDPDRSIYRGADLLYALRLPPELHGSFAALARDLDVPAAFTTLGGDPPAVPADPHQLPGTTLFRNVEPNDAATRRP